MRKLFTLTTFSFIGPFAATFFVVLFVLLMQFLWIYIDDLVGKGLEWYVVAKLLFFASASFVPLALPLAVLLSSIMSFGKLAETYELVALKSAGISLLRIMVPQIWLVFFISVGAFFFSNDVIPVANLKFKALLWDVRQQKPALDIKPGVFYGGIENYSIRIRKKDEEGRNLEDITIYDHTRPGNNIVMKAERGDMAVTEDERFLIINLYDGVRYEEMENRNPSYRTYPANRMAFSSYNMQFDLSSFALQKTKEELFKEHYEMLNIAQLEYYQDSLKRIMGRKREEILAYGRPYFTPMRDTAYHLNTTMGFDTLPPNRAFIRAFPKENRLQMLSQAINSARSIRDVLSIQADGLDEYTKLLSRYGIEWHRKFALAMACLTLFFIGAPLGAIIRKGGIGMPTVVSIVMFVFFYILTIAFEKMAKELLLTPFVGMWLPTFILLPIGFFLTWKANTDSISFDTGRITRFFSSLGARLKRRSKTDADTAAV